MVNVLESVQVKGRHRDMVTDKQTPFSDLKAGLSFCILKFFKPRCPMQEQET